MTAPFLPYTPSSPDSEAHPPPSASSHFLLLLSDSALPLGSFAFSSGLESYQAHQARGSGASFAVFLPLSLSSYASTALPFVFAAHRDPTALQALDDALDAAMPCAVGRRASVAQDRALLTIWQKAFAGSGSGSGSSSPPSSRADGAAAEEALAAFGALLRTTSSRAAAAAHLLPPPVSAHLPPLFGAVCRAAGLDEHQAAYVFLLGHAKALVSAAVRAGLFGPYQAQSVLASAGTRELVEAVIARERAAPVEAAGQSVPVLDLWVGRHELLYSRIFNS